MTMKKYTFEDMEQSIANGEHYQSILAKIVNTFVEDKYLQRGEAFTMINNLFKHHAKNIIEKEINHLINEKNWL